MSEKVVKELTRKRGTLKGKLTSFVKFLESYTPEDGVDQLTARYEKLEELWTQFSEVQGQLDLIEEDDETKLQSNQNERITFEETYYQCVGKSRQFIREAGLPSQLITSQSQETSASMLMPAPHFKLPPLNLTTFDGSYENWTEFSDSFLGAIDKYPGLQAVHKLRYLRSCLTGKAAEIIKSVETTDENYAVAWNLLRDNCENKRMIVHKHIKMLYDLPTVTRESAAELNALYTGAQAHIRVLKKLGQSTDDWGALLLHLMTSKLDRYTLKEWEKKIKGLQVPTMAQFWEFLKEHCQMLDSMTMDSSNAAKTVTKQAQSTRAKPQQACVATSSPKGTCPVCKQQHNIQTCEKFQKLTYEKKIELVKSTALCFNCLRYGHLVGACNASRCKKCNRKHHTLLHNEEVKPPIVEMAESDNESTTTLQACSQSSVLLSTALVDIVDDKGKGHLCRILLDSGSQSNFMTTSFANKLGNEQKTIRIPVAGFNASTMYINSTVNATVKSRCNQYQEKLNFLVAPKIVDYLPTQKINKAKLEIPKNLFLADPTFNRPADIDALLGAEVFYQLLCLGQVKVAETAMLQKTKFGWIVAGRIPGSNETPSQRPHCFLSTNLLESQVKKFWELDELPVEKLLSPEEKACEDHFLKHVTRNQEGRYVVGLPFNGSKSLLGESYNSALKRLLSLERKLAASDDLNQQYKDFLLEYEMLGHMKKFEPNKDKKPIVYIPHQAVLKAESLTTKMRVVFDASAKTTTGVSLNDSLMCGATLQPSLFSILASFRTHEVAMIADVEKMYRQVLVHEEDTYYQCILWRPDKKLPISAYRLKTLTYGTASASHLAIRTLYKLSEDEGNIFPQAAKVVQEEMYVDDIFTGAKNLEDARILQNQLISLFQSGGFKLKKWASNKPELLESLSQNEDPHLCLNTKDKLRTLGINWIPDKDHLLYTVKVTNNEKVTKRIILSETASLFDPLGLLGPVVTLAKILLQGLWKVKLSWDESLPLDTTTKWSNFRKELPLLMQIRIPRKILMSDCVDVQLHGFADASEDAYGACIYLRSQDNKGQLEAHLVCSKSRVAPLKKQSIPRLELCAAQLLARLLQTVRSSLKIQIENIWLWSDSMITLQWINAAPHTLETFVSNRVSKIQELTDVRWWNHVKGSENPADIISRGSMPQGVVNNNTWFHGPTWLCLNQEEWPKVPINSSKFEIGLKKGSSIFVSALRFDLLTKFSSISKLQRVVAYIFLFFNKLKKRVECKETARDAKCEQLECTRVEAFSHCKESQVSVTASQLEKAMTCILKLVQAEAFAEELRFLKCNKAIPRTSKLFRLIPFLDKDGLIRLKGRIEYANVNYNQKHQIILPRNHHVTRLIVNSVHITCMHGGSQVTLNAIRQNYWPIDGKNIVNSVIRSCVTCFRFNTTTPKYVMADLPESRFETSRPFVNVGVDFCGPFFIKQKRERNRGRDKVYVAIFICFACKAVHLELVGDLTSASFIQALKRFCARRGKPKALFSDNATNFTGANRELKEIVDALDLESQNSRVLRFSANEGIEWKFIPPRSPHFGGIWEAAVRSFKNHFRRIVGEELLSYEQFNTIIIEIEGILNSRPLTPISFDSSDITALTPSHFLVGDYVKNIPERDLSEITSNRLSAWQRVQKIKQAFWKRWNKEYLNEINQRSKWFDQTPIKFEVGQIVILKEDNTPCSVWPLAKIVEVHPGRDGTVRVISVKTSSGVFKRCVKKVAILPINDNSNLFDSSRVNE